MVVGSIKGRSSFYDGKRRVWIEYEFVVGSMKCYVCIPSGMHPIDNPFKTVQEVLDAHAFYVDQCAKKPN